MPLKFTDKKGRSLADTWQRRANWWRETALRYQAESRWLDRARWLISSQRNEIENLRANSTIVPPTDMGMSQAFIQDIRNVTPTQPQSPPETLSVLTSHPATPNDTNPTATPAQVSGARTNINAPSSVTTFNNTGATNETRPTATNNDTPEESTTHGPEFRTLQTQFDFGNDTVLSLYIQGTDQADLQRALDMVAEHQRNNTPTPALNPIAGLHSYQHHFLEARHITNPETYHILSSTNNNSSAEGAAPEAIFRTESDRMCAICHEDYAADDAVVSLPCEASHRFHLGCLKTWHQTKLTCPMCRTRFVWKLNVAVDQESDDEDGDVGDEGGAEATDGGGWGVQNDDGTDGDESNGSVEGSSRSEEWEEGGRVIVEREDDVMEF